MYMSMFRDLEIGLSEDLKDGERVLRKSNAVGGSWRDWRSDRSSGYLWWTSGSRDNPMWANFGKQNWRWPSPFPPCVQRKRARVYVRNVTVCTGTTRTCVSTCARGAGAHGDVLSLYTGLVLSRHTGYSRFHTSHTTPHHTHHTAHTSAQDTTHHNNTTTTPHGERNRDRQRDGQREKRRQKKTKQDKTGEDETRQEGKRRWKRRDTTREEKIEKRRQEERRKDREKTRWRRERLWKTREETRWREWRWKRKEETRWRRERRWKRKEETRWKRRQKMKGKMTEKMKRDRDEREDERKMIFPQNVSRPSNPPDEWAQHVSKKSRLLSKVQNLTVFSIIYMIRIRFSRLWN